jgi:hypothetical protein
MRMSVWADEDLENKVIEVLNDVPLVNIAHHFGRPYMSAYQLAIELHRRYPSVAQALQMPLGGAGVGQQNSLSQYLARELSRRIRDNPQYPVEGAFISNKDVESLVYASPEGPLTSSLSHSGYDLSMFRLVSNAAGAS